MGAEQEGAGAVRQDVAIWYTGARYELGRWQHGYALWAAGGSRSQPLAHWPQTPEGWAAAWAHFTAVEPPGSIVHQAQPPGPAGPAQPVAGILLAVGVLAGLIGLFPSYFAGSSLASQPPEVVPHAIYLAAWAVSAALVFAGGGRRRVGALLALGVSVVTFGFFVTDVGTVLAGAAAGPGLSLSLIGWLAASAGGLLALRIPAADRPGRPRTAMAGPMAALAAAVIAGLGVAITFAPAWDAYTLRTPGGLNSTVTAGNAFANPGVVVAGNVAVMVALVAAVVAAALWRPMRIGAALLAGAAIPMLAQALSAIIQIGEPVSSTQFGISPQQAAGAGLTINSGLTPVFWVYCLFVIALVTTGVGMFFSVSRVAAPAAPAGAGAPWPVPFVSPAADQPPVPTPGAVPAPSVPAPGDVPVPGPAPAAGGVPAPGPVSAAGGAPAADPAPVPGSVPAPPGPAGNPGGSTA